MHFVKTTILNSKSIDNSWIFASLIVYSYSLCFHTTFWTILYVTYIFVVWKLKETFFFNFYFPLIWPRDRVMTSQKNFLHEKILWYISKKGWKFQIHCPLISGDICDWTRELEYCSFCSGKVAANIPRLKGLKSYIFFNCHMKIRLQSL